MNDLAAQISSKSEDRSQRARTPAPVTDNIDTNHYVDAKKLTHGPPAYLESDRAASQLGNHGNHDLNPMTSEKKAGAKKLAHAPPVYLQSDQAASQLSNHDNHDLNPMTPEEKVDAKKLADAPPIFFEPDQATPGAFRLGDPDNGDHHPMTSREDAHVQNLSDMPPEPPESNRAKPGAFRVGGQDNDDGEEVRSHGVVTQTLHVSALLVEDDPEVDIVVAVLATDERGNKRCLIYISIGVLVIFVVVAIVLGVTLPPRSSQSGTTPAPTPAPTPLQRDSIISLIRSRSPSTSFSNASSPQTQALDWISTDPYSSYELSDDRLVQRFALATFYCSTNGDDWSDHDARQWLNSTNECLWDGISISCSPASAVKGLDLPRDGLSGRIPIEVGLLNRLTSFNLEGNQLTGSLPSELGLLNQLTALDLEGNQLTGSLPSELGLLNQLTALDLEGNQLIGSLPSELGLLTQLSWLDLYGNQLTGSIPSSLCDAGVDIYVDCGGEIVCTCCFSGDDPFPPVDCPS
jgi:hypothetical protein